MAYDFANDKLATGTPAAGATLKLHAERLEIKKTTVYADAHIRKDLLSELRSFDVPLVREELTIKRRRTSGDPLARETIGESYAFRVPLSREKLSLRIVTVVAEEVNIGKRRVTRSEHVSGSLRHEDLQIEGISPAKASNVR